MADKDIIEMSLREVKRLKAVHEAMEGHITQRAAALMMGVSERQSRRLVRAVRAQGDRGVVHKGRGRTSNRRMPDKIKDRVISLYRGKYLGFGPVLASEKLMEMDGVRLSDETLRKWLITAGLWEKRRKRPSHRQWRERKACFGEMVQMDGSHHDWLEDRGPWLVLMGYIDDATNNIYGRFYDYEGTLPAMGGFKGYVRRYGLPQSVYLDRHTTYKSTKELTPEEELKGQSAPLSQFERALKELGVEVIHAYSPQAKGRIERLFGVLQDRLVKEMRLDGIKTKDEANVFLKGYLPGYNKRFRVPAANDTDMHVRLPKYFDMDKYLCVKTQRTVRNDNTISHDGRLYQIKDAVRTKKVMVEERIDGSMRISITGDDRVLGHREITGRPTMPQTAKSLRPKRAYIPAKDHPWRKRQNRKSHPLRDGCSPLTE